MNGAELRAGRPVCVIGETARAELFGSGDPLGQSIRIGKVSCQIIGLLAAKGTSSIPDANDVIVMPLKTFSATHGGQP